MSQFAAAIHPVGRMSVSSTTWSSVRSSGTLKGPTSAKGTRTYSACPPAYPPIRCEYPKIPAGEWPNRVSAIPALGLELSQQLNSPRLQKKQFPHEMGNGTTTRSPTRSRSRGMPEPTSTTSPMNSWPRMSPFRIVGMNPSYRCRSDPQMQVEPTFTIASRGLRISGSGTSSTPIVLVPHQVTAFISGLLSGFGPGRGVNTVALRARAHQPECRRPEPAQSPRGCPWMVGISPVSRTRLKFRRSSRICW